MNPMTPSTRWLRALGLCTALALPMAGAWAQPAFPAKPVRIVVQFAAGGGSDTLARAIADGLSKRLGQPVIVDNKAGAGGIIGADYVAKAAPDGYTLLLTIPGAVTSFKVIYKKLPYDPETDFRLISDIALPRTVLAVNPSVPAKNYKELLELIKSAPDKYTMGSWGPGVQPHQLQVFMDKTYGTKTALAAYKGDAPMAMDLISGVIPMAVGSTVALKPHIVAGKLRPLAVFGSSRTKALPEVPTFAEQGYKDDVYMTTAPYYLMAPARTPDAIVERLGRDVAVVVRQPEVLERMEGLGLEPMGDTPAEATALYKASLPKLLKLARDTGVTVD